MKYLAYEEHLNLTPYSCVQQCVPVAQRSALGPCCRSACATPALAPVSFHPFRLGAVGCPESTNSSQAFTTSQVTRDHRRRPACVPKVRLPAYPREGGKVTDYGVRGVLERWTPSLARLPLPTPAREREGA